MTTASSPRLPREILSEIPLYLGDTGDLKECCLAAWIFVESCRIGIFSTLKFSEQSLEREKHHANAPHLTAYSKRLSLWIYPPHGDVNREISYLLAILSAIPNVVQLELVNALTAAEQLKEALIKFVAPQIVQMRLDCVYLFPLSTLINFPLLKTLELTAGLWEEEPLPKWTNTREDRHSPLNTISFIYGDHIEDSKITVLNQYLRAQSCKIKKMEWSVIPSYDETHHPPLLGFCELFTMQSESLTCLVITECTRARFTSDLIGSLNHPWALRNLPRLETLTFPATVEDHITERYYENISWIVDNFRDLTQAHPLKHFHLFVTKQSEPALPIVPWSDLDSSLQSLNFPDLEEVAFDLGLARKEEPSDIRLHHALPICEERMLLQGINFSVCRSAEN